MCAAQDPDLLSNLKAGVGSIDAYRAIRKHLSRLDADRIISNDIEMMYNLVHGGKTVSSVEKKLEH